jgi:hypothetical protein
LFPWKKETEEQELKTNKANKQRKELKIQNWYKSQAKLNAN